MELHTLLMVGFVVLAATAAFVTARVGGVAIGVLPPATGASGARGDGRDGDAEPNDADEADERVAVARDDTEGWGASRITTGDRERMRRHLEKDPLRRSPDDLVPSDDETE